MTNSVSDEADVSVERVRTPLALVVVSGGMSLLLTVSMALLTILSGSLFFGGIAVAFAGRTYRTVAFARLCRRGSSARSDDEPASSIFKRTGGAYLVGGALCAVSAAITREPAAFIFAVLLTAGAAGMWFVPRLLARTGVDGKQWPMRWFP